MEIPKYALGTQKLWTPKLVKEALVEAHLVLFDTTGGVGPRGPGSSWPAYASETQDYWEQWRSGTHRIGKMRARVQRTSKQIHQSDIVLFGGKKSNGDPTRAWLSGALLGYPEYKEKLVIWTMIETAKERGRNRKTVRDVCRKNGWAYSSFRWQRDKAAAIIADRLNRDQIQVW